MPENGRDLTSAAIAERVEGSLIGPSAIRVSGVASLAEAGPEHVSFLADTRYLPALRQTRAGVVLVGADLSLDQRPERAAWVVCRSPSEAFSGLVEWFAPPEIQWPAGIHAAAVVDETAEIDETAYVGACAVVEAGARIGAGSVVGAGVYIGHGSRIGCDCLLHANVTVRERCLLGDRVIVHSGSVIGSDGYGYVTESGRHRKIPQRGIVQIDDDVELGACVTVDRARFGRTWIKAGAKIDNLVQIAHNVVIGEGCLIVAQVGIAGSSTLGKGVVCAGQSGIGGHLSVGDGAVLLARAAVTKNLEPGAMVMGTPAEDRRAFARKQMALSQVGTLRKQVKDLQRRLDALAGDRDD
jgi:UDP-3-O-[3-hydroxymyristoyl] glucosamine N-acyltransferase